MLSLLSSDEKTMRRLHNLSCAVKRVVWCYRLKNASELCSASLPMHHSILYAHNIVALNLFAFACGMD